jgi:histidine triad (HIT) family protein
MSKTLFQRIIDREIPATIEFENDEIIAIRDIAPSASTHILVIPKKPIPTVNDLTEADAELVGKVYLVARDLAAKYDIDASGYRIVTNCNADAGQTVFHLHFHVLGGQQLGRMNSMAPSHQGGMGNVLLEAGIILLLSIGLAVGFNMMNPKRIAWVKPEYERVEASQTELDRILGGAATNAETTAPASQPVAGSVPASSATPVATVPPAPAATGATSSAAPATQSMQTAPAPAFVAEPGVIREIKLDAFKKLLGRSAVYLIDARIPEKFAEGHVDGAVNVDGNTVEANIPQLLSIPKERIIVIYCDGGHCELSHRVADVLKNFGYGPILIYTGGWAEWSGKGS